MKTRIIIIIALTLLSSLTIGQTIKDTTDQNKSSQDGTWEVDIKFDLPSLDPEAIQIGWFTYDPTYKFNFTFDNDYLNKQLKNAKDEKEKEISINAQIDYTWNNLFDIVKGSELYLLTKTGAMVKETNCEQSKAYKWLVSKVFYIEDKPYAYIIPIKILNNSKQVVILNKDNLTSLMDLYKRIRK